MRIQTLNTQNSKNIANSVEDMKINEDVWNVYRTRRFRYKSLRLQLNIKMTFENMLSLDLRGNGG